MCKKFAISTDNDCFFDIIMVLESEMFDMIMDVRKTNKNVSDQFYHILVEEPADWENQIQGF